MTFRTIVLAWTVPLAFGCTTTNDDALPDAAEDSTSTTAPNQQSSTSHSGNASDPVGSSTSDGATETGFDPEGAQCDAETQDCPEDYKCVLRRGARDWEFVCLPVQGEGQAGDSCTHDGVSSGTDTCDQDTWCIGSFDASGEPWSGICYPLCVDDVCESTLDVCVGIGALPVCAPACDPLIPGSCAATESCILRGYDDGFVCFPAGVEAQPIGAPCETGISCETGLHCSQNVAGCGAEEYCCTDLCDTTVAETQCMAEADGAACVAIGVAAPGQEHLGACVVQ